MKTKMALFTIFLAMVCAILFLDAVLPLRELWFHEALLTQIGSWPVLPSLLVFPGWPIIPPIAGRPHINGLPDVAQSWYEIGLLFIAFLIIFLVYLLALRRVGEGRGNEAMAGEGTMAARETMAGASPATTFHAPMRVPQVQNIDNSQVVKPQYMTPRFLLGSTLFLGILYALLPVVTSPDLFSYIAYARIGVIYHLNPLTTLPTVIRSDPIYSYVAWIDQPSAYGPTWIIITCLLQWLSLPFGVEHILPMVIGLRLLGLAMHLCSTGLVYSLSNHVQFRSGGAINRAPTFVEKAVLAFAWNPLLLFEACTNAHNDTVLLFCILLALWFVVRATPRAFVIAAILLAVATCLKITLVVLVPGFLLFLWMQCRFSRLFTVAGVYFGAVVLLYAPFWQGGAVLRVFSVNPGASRNINTLAAFLGQFYNAVAAALGAPLAPPVGSPAEHFMHTASMALFLVLYGVLCWRGLRKSYRLRTIAGVRAEPSHGGQTHATTFLIRWWAIVELLYCALGTPWSWPWYAVTFFGLYALLETYQEGNKINSDVQWRWLRGREKSALYIRLPLAVRLLSFSMLTLYCFYAWGPQYSFVPGLPRFEWAYFSGLWVWLLPLLALRRNLNFKIGQRYHFKYAEFSD